MKEQIKFANGVSYDLSKISSVNNNLTFSIKDVDKVELEELLKDTSNIKIIKMIYKNEETQDETLIKAYAGYVNLSIMKTEYGIITNVDYNTQDESTESGFAEEKHDITTIVLLKPTKTESELASIKESLTLQDGAIEELATVVSDISEGQELQDGAIEDIATVVSEIAEESEETE